MLDTDMLIGTPAYTKAMLGYFGQSRFYFSESKLAPLTIAAMAPRHCANAAERMIREAERIVSDLGIDTAYPVLWVTTTTLFQALAKRGAEQA
jgi:hypothetical protein